MDKKQKISKDEKNKKIIKRDTHTIDAENKVLGRLATEVAILLRGKNKVNFLPYLDQGNFVKIVNIKKIKITGNKLNDKKYFRYTGYPGGLREKKIKDVFKKDPGEVLKRAINNMLPKNKLRKEMLKRLIIL
ncbi:MAG: large subunit ribosomal protein L13 [Parcubacteria group bacterium Athens1014_10]|nr:MAG: large subunit ribosomal protein L13 [Parcubacteria group bacterium Athens1014_10]TSD06053.1 MAG: large subunit ribosomal protein L13 [Parcubacteria group bacterium Athens0714_12]